MNDKRSDSTASLFGDAMGHAGALVRAEVDLARAEIDQNVRRAGAALGMLAAAMAIALTALIVLTAAIVEALTEAGIDPGWAALIVGVVLAAIAAALGYKATQDLKLSGVAPTRTAASVRRDAQAVEGRLG
jgi:hypothetical protein